MEQVTNDRTDCQGGGAVCATVAGKMAVHEWTTEIVDGGPVGEGEFWVCAGCGCGGGPTGGWDGKATEPWPPFLPGTGLKLSLDCDEAQKEIRAYRSTPEYRKQQAQEARLWADRMRQRLQVQGSISPQGVLTVTEPAPFQFWMQEEPLDRHVTTEFQVRFGIDQGSETSLSFAEAEKTLRHYMADKERYS